MAPLQSIVVEIEFLEVPFNDLDAQIESAGYIPRKGQIADASIIEAPRQRNSRDENEQIKSGETPVEWSEPKRRQKDVEGRWTQKRKKSYYGYKNHIGVDHAYKIIRRWLTTDASVHDSQVFYDLLDDSNSSGEVWGDSAYWSGDKKEELAELGFSSRIHRKGVRGKPLNERSAEANRKRSKIRARVEHVFGQQALFGRYIRTIGWARARIKIGMTNLAYNMKRLAWLMDHAPPCGRQVKC